MRCPYCNARNKKDAEHCTRCGNAIYEQPNSDFIYTSNRPRRVISRNWYVAAICIVLIVAVIICGFSLNNHVKEKYGGWYGLAEHFFNSIEFNFSEKKEEGDNYINFNDTDRKAPLPDATSSPVP